MGPGWWRLPISSPPPLPPPRPLPCPMRSAGIHVACYFVFAGNPFVGLRAWLCVCTSQMPPSKRPMKQSLLFPLADKAGPEGGHPAHPPTADALEVPATPFDGHTGDGGAGGVPAWAAAPAPGPAPGPGTGGGAGEAAASSALPPAQSSLHASPTSAFSGAGGAAAAGLTFAVGTGAGSARITTPATTTGSPGDGAKRRAGGTGSPNGRGSGGPGVAQHSTPTTLAVPASAAPVTLPSQPSGVGPVATGSGGGAVAAVAATAGGSAGVGIGASGGMGVRGAPPASSPAGPMALGAHVRNAASMGGLPMGISQGPSTCLPAATGTSGGPGASGQVSVPPGGLSALEAQRLRAELTDTQVGLPVRSFGFGSRLPGTFVSTSTGSCGLTGWLFFFFFFLLALGVAMLGCGPHSMCSLPSLVSPLRVSPALLHMSDPVDSVPARAAGD
jgi:hypothetical protein